MISHDTKGLSPDALRALNARYARYVRLSELMSIKSRRGEKYMLRLELEDQWGMVLDERSDPEPKVVV